MNEAERWVQFGQYLVEQRQRLGLRRRDAAKRAKLSEGTWRDLEAGHKNTYSGLKLLPNPTTEVLQRVAEALELPPDDLIGRMPRPTRRKSSDNQVRSEDADALTPRIARLSPRDRRVVERLIDTLLEDD